MKQCVKFEIFGNDSNKFKSTCIENLRSVSIWEMLLTFGPKYFVFKLVL